MSNVLLIECNSHSWENRFDSLDKVDQFFFPLWQSTISHVLKKHGVNDLNVINTITSGIQISVMMSDDSTIKKYNNQYRQKNQPTNVLSFPQHEGLTEIIEHFVDAEQMLLLGDIILSFGTIQRQAKQFFKSFEDHLAHLWVHSLLHLLGFDHIIDKERSVMENLEIAVLKNHGIGNPYIEGFAIREQL